MQKEIKLKQSDFFLIVQRKGEPEREMGHQYEKEVGMGDVLKRENSWTW